MAVRDALLSTRQNALQDSFLDAANRLSLRFHAPGPWNPCLPCELRERERLYAAPRNAPPCLATVTKGYKKTATICFDTGESATITERSNFTFTPPNTPPLPPGDITHYHLSPSFSSPQTRSPDIPVPLQADLMDSTCEGHWFHQPNLRHVLNHEDLLGGGAFRRQTSSPSSPLMTRRGFIRMEARVKGAMAAPSLSFGNNSVTSSAARHPRPLQGAPSNGPWQWR